MHDEIALRHADASAAREAARVRLDTSLELLLARAPPAPAARVLATVVATAGSTYRKRGARMLFLEDGASVGLLSGGCLESDLALKARAVLERDAACTVEYDMRGPDDELFGIGAGCEGAMRVLLEPGGVASRAGTALRRAGESARSGESSILIAVHEAHGLALGTYDAESLPELLVPAAARALRERRSHEALIEHGSERLRAFVEFLPPPPHLLICGAGPDAEPVVNAACALGWRVSVVDHRPAFADPERFRGARVVCAHPAVLGTAIEVAGCHAAVVMSHHLESDIAYLRALAAEGAPGYVGLLGPAPRRQRIAQELGPTFEALRRRLRGPVGLDLGARTPEAIALAIVSEVHAWLAGRGGVVPTAESALLISSG